MRQPHPNPPSFLLNSVYFHLEHKVSKDRGLKPVVPLLLMMLMLVLSSSVALLKTVYPLYIPYTIETMC